MIQDPNNPTPSAFPSSFIPSLFGTRNGIQGFAFARLLSPRSSFCSLQSPLQGCGSLPFHCLFLRNDAFGQPALIHNHM